MLYFLDIPNSKENYIHRIGRSGRFGRKGVAINFINNRDAQMIKEIESFYNTSGSSDAGIHQRILVKCSLFLLLLKYNWIK